MKAKPGHIIDEHGVERKVLGTLPLTADGCVVGDEAVVVDSWGTVQIVYAAHEDLIYSTREAAEAARNANP